DAVNHHRVIVARRQGAGCCAPSSCFLAFSPHAALESSMFNCLSRSRYRRSQSKRLLSKTKSTQSSPVESRGVTAADRYEIDTVAVQGEIEAGIAGGVQGSYRRRQI